MTRFEAYTLRRLLIPLVAAGYASAAITLTSALHMETFPFFNWSLFSSTAAKRSDIVVMIRKVDGLPVDPPSLYYEMTDTFAAAKSRNILIRKSARRMAQAIRAGDEATIASMRRLIEHTFMREVGEVEYDLAVVSYDPIVRRQSGAIDAVNVITSFKKEAP